MSFEVPDIKKESSKESIKEDVIAQIRAFFEKYSLTTEDFFFDVALSNNLPENLLEAITIDYKKDDTGDFVTEEVFFKGKLLASSRHIRNHYDSDAEIKVYEDVLQEMFDV